MGWLSELWFEPFGSSDDPGLPFFVFFLAPAFALWFAVVVPVLCLPVVGLGWETFFFWRFDPVSFRGLACTLALPAGLPGLRFAFGSA